MLLPAATTDRRRSSRGEENQRRKAEGRHQGKLPEVGQLIALKCPGHVRRAPPFSSSFACVLDADPCLVDKTLAVLIGPAEQIAFDNERAAADRLGAAFPEVAATYRLVSRTRLTLGACPAVRPVARPSLEP